MDEIANTSGVQTCSLHAPSQCEKPAEIDNLCYEAESPDEAALVYAAKAYGFVLLARTPNSVTVRLPSGEDLVFEVLDTLAFDYNRKRMSVLVRHPITKEYVLYIKGADYAIMELLGTPYAGMHVRGQLHLHMFIPGLFYYIHVLVSTEPLWVISFKMKLYKYFCVMLFSENISGTQKAIATNTQHHLNSYAKDGLRTLCIAKKVHNQIHKYLPASFPKTQQLFFISFLHVLQVVSDKEFASWSVNRQRALAAIEKREELIMESAAQLETNLTLLGNTHQPNTYHIIHNKHVSNIHYTVCVMNSVCELCLALNLCPPSGATGIEDRLQESVPDTIVALREAGIQVWVLTGDKPETAVNIGYACRLLEEEDLVINMSCASKVRRPLSASLKVASLIQSCWVFTVTARLKLYI